MDNLLNSLVETTPEQVFSRFADRTAAELNKHASRLGGSFDVADFTEALKRRYSRTFGFTTIFRFQLSGIWGAECDVTVKSDVVNEDSMRDTRTRLQSSASIGWSSTSRSVGQATATIALYQRALEFASIAEALLSFEISRVAK